MNRSYDVRVTATIEVGGTFEAEDAGAAQEAAIRELKTSGELSNIVVERCIFLDEDEASMPAPIPASELPLHGAPDPGDFPPEYYDPGPPATSF